MPLFGASTILNLVPRIDIKSIPASATTITDVVYGDQIWMDRNLGARRVALAMNDVFGFGNHYQWGRPADGHEITVFNGETEYNGASNGTDSGRHLYELTSTLATTTTPGHNNFIINPTEPKDWLATPADPDRWETANQGPCPTGYHVPTETEISTTLTSSTGDGSGTNGSDTSGWDNSEEAFNSDLAIPSAGRTVQATGNFQSLGGGIFLIWTSSVNGKLPGKTTILHTVNGPNTSLVLGGGSRAAGYTVRCLKN
jgi:uncharacterized protein (TIGR02145 family)